MLLSAEARLVVGVPSLMTSVNPNPLSPGGC